MGNNQTDRTVGITTNDGAAGTANAVLSGEHEELFTTRLAYSGLNPDYLREAQTETYVRLASACASCDSVERCTKDLAADDWETGLSQYCPNAEAIDIMIAGVEAVDPSSSDR